MGRTVAAVKDPLLPLVIGGAVVVRRPAGTGGAARRRKRLYALRVKRLTVEVVMETGRHLGRIPVEMPRTNPGYDIRSKDPETGHIWFIDVQGRVKGAS